MKHLLKLICLLTPLAGFADSGWKSAQPGYHLVFPKDHGSHPEHRVEWWYFTGNLEAAGRQFGYQLTFFRFGMNAAPPNPSAWSVRDLHMAHFAISDLRDKDFLYAQRFGRTGPGFCGSAKDTMNVWQEDWSARLADDGVIRLKAKDTGAKPMAIDLTLRTNLPPVSHGDGGYCAKGQSAGNASIYYSFTKLETSGTLTISDRPHTVSGVSWMDHEFGTQFLETDRQGWDWMSLHLNDGSDLMIYQLRSVSGAAKVTGTLVDKEGRAISLLPGEALLTPGEKWKSPESGGEYPVNWRVQLPKQGIELKISTPLATQEISDSSTQIGPSYWEGAVTAEGTYSGKAMSGFGYLEMTGYVGRPMASFFALPK